MKQISEDWGLEGLFDEPAVSAEIDIRDLERRKLAELIRGDSQYKPEDIIGIAFGTKNRFHGNKIHAVYLTQRGLDESQLPELARSYERLNTKLGTYVDVSPFRSSIESGIIAKMIEICTNKDYLNLGGKDGKKRILITYAKDTTVEMFDG